MKNIVLFILMIASGTIFAQQGWQRINYMQSTIFSAEVTINNSPLSAGDKVGAFVKNECRMIAPIILLDNKTYISSVIHGDVPEEVEFRIWIQNKDSVITVPQKVMTKPGGSILNYQIQGEIH